MTSQKDWQGLRGRGSRVAVHPEAVERLEAWLAIMPLAGGETTPMFRAPRSSRGEGRDGFKESALSVRATEYLVSRYVAKLGLDPSITVYSSRVTALTTAGERGADLIDLQDFAGRSDPRTTLTYIRQRERLSKSPTYVLKY